MPDGMQASTSFEKLALLFDLIAKQQKLISEGNLHDALHLNEEMEKLVPTEVLIRIRSRIFRLISALALEISKVEEGVKDG